MKGEWRIEEFIDDGRHPSIERVTEKEFRNLMAVYTGKFHSLKIGIQNEGPVLLKKLNDPNISKIIHEKISQKGLFSEEE